MTRDTTPTQAGYPGMLPATEQRVRAALAGHPRALLTDIDGTISAIAPTPAAATLLPGVRDILLRATSVFDLVGAISGRAALDARHMIDIAAMHYIGNHGLGHLPPGSEREYERRLLVAPAAREYRAQIGALLEMVAREVAPRFPGMLVERKGVTGSIHYRRASDPDAAERAIMRALGDAAEQLRMTHGKQVIELRPPVDIDKGTAIADLARAYTLGGAIYLGDDRTDIDAFRALRHLTAEGSLAGFVVAVLSAEAPDELGREADLTLASVDEVPTFLRWLVDAASRSRPGAQAPRGGDA